MTDGIVTNKAIASEYDDCDRKQYCTPRTHKRNSLHSPTYPAQRFKTAKFPDLLKHSHT